jgi:outer membrane protein OmpA-like peptidoglycan-associated protein
MNNAPLKEIDSFSYIINTKYGKSDPVKVILERSNISLDKLPENLQKTFLPIYYNYNDSDLLLNYKNRVDAVALAMNENPQLVVEVSSYSDCRGKREYNLELSEQRNQTIINYVKNTIEKPERVFGKGYGEDHIEGNDTKDYLILGGTFASFDLAELRKKEFVSIGYPAEIKVNVNGLYQIVLDQANTAFEANKIFNRLKNVNIETWVSRCECCSLSEEEHKSNRRTEFNIIKF